MGFVYFDFRKKNIHKFPKIKSLLQIAVLQQERWQRRRNQQKKDRFLVNRLKNQRRLERKLEPVGKEHAKKTIVPWKQSMKYRV